MTKEQAEPWIVLDGSFAQWGSRYEFLVDIFLNVTR